MPFYVVRPDKIDPNNALIRFDGDHGDIRAREWIKSRHPAAWVMHTDDIYVTYCIRATEPKDTDDLVIVMKADD